MEEIEQSTPEIIEEPVIEDEVLDEDDFIKKKSDGMFSSWQELNEALAAQKAQKAAAAAKKKVFSLFCMVISLLAANHLAYYSY